MRPYTRCVGCKACWFCAVWPLPLGSRVILAAPGGRVERCGHSHSDSLVAFGCRCSCSGPGRCHLQRCLSFVPVGCAAILCCRVPVSPSTIRLAVCRQAAFAPGSRGGSVDLPAASLVWTRIFIGVQNKRVLVGSIIPGKSLVFSDERTCCGSCFEPHPCSSAWIHQHTILSMSQGCDSASGRGRS